MRIEDWFAMAVRVFGVLTLVGGLTWLVDAFLFKLGYFIHNESSPSTYLITGLAQTTIGIYLMRGAGSLVAFCYPAADDDLVEDDGEEP